jgi:hypothetical protein
MFAIVSGTLPGMAFPSKMLSLPDKNLEPPLILWYSKQISEEAD